MNHVEASVRLRDHADRTITTFLRTNEDAALESAFWGEVYRGHDGVDHAVAAAVADELEGSRRRVGDLFTGWRPRALVAGAP
jgi:hypothetical protein